MATGICSACGKTFHYSGMASDNLECPSCRSQGYVGSLESREGEFDRRLSEHNKNVLGVVFPAYGIIRLGKKLFGK